MSEFPVSTLVDDPRGAACTIASFHGIPESDEELDAYVRKVANRDDELVAAGEGDPGMRDFLIDAFLGLGYDRVVVAEAFSVPLDDLERIREGVRS